MPKEKVWYDISYKLRASSTWVPFALPEGEDKALECVCALMHKSSVENILITVQDVPPEFILKHA